MNENTSLHLDISPIIFLITFIGSGRIAPSSFLPLGLSVLARSQLPAARSIGSFARPLRFPVLASSQLPAADSYSNAGLLIYSSSSPFSAFS